MTPKDIAASIRARLLNYARDVQEDFQMLLNRYARERLLYRLSQSSYRERFVLKGATLFSVWSEKPFRSTRDADFLSFGPNDVASVASVFRELCGIESEDSEDGVRFDSTTIQAAQIREEEEYAGVRILLDAFIGKAKARVQVDIGFGDAITPEAQEIKLPVILELPAPSLRAYPKETVVAEKLQAMAVLAETNSRMKDFYDLWVLQRYFEFTGKDLAAAIQATFARRRTDVDPASCLAFQPSFYASEEPRARWQLYVSRGSFEKVPPAFAEVGQRIEAFLRPVCEAIASDSEFAQIWPPGGPWNSKEDG
jgi:predicted nucleotidyltransferase component of viral defense system